MDALIRDRILRLAGVEMRAEPGQRYRHGWIPIGGADWMKSGAGAIKKIHDGLSNAFGSVHANGVDWKGAHFTIDVGERKVPVSVTPVDVASLALLAVPGGNVAEAAKIALIVQRIRRALKVAKVAETVAHAVTRDDFVEHEERASVADDAAARHRLLALAGIPDLAPIELRGRPHAGQKFRHGWVPVSPLALLSPDVVDEEYGRELDSAEFGDTGRIVAREHGVTVESDSGSDLAIHATPSADDAERWATAIRERESFSRSSFATEPHDGGMSVRFGDHQVDLDDSDADEVAQALLDMAYVTEDHQNVPDDEVDEDLDVDEMLTDIDDDPRALRHRSLALAGVAGLASMPQPDFETRALINAIRAHMAGETRDWKKQIRDPGGEDGGQWVKGAASGFKSLLDRAKDALAAWSKGDGPDNPLAGYDREQLRKVAKDLNITLRRGAPADEISGQIFDHIRAGGVPDKPDDAHRRFTITHGGKPTDVGISTYQGSGHLFVHRESDAGRRGARVSPEFANLAELESWARENGHTELADYVRDRQGKAVPGKPVKVAKSAPKKAANPLEDAARARQAKADTARGVAETLTELDELSSNGASPKAMETRLRAQGKISKVDPATLDTLVQAGVSGDRVQVDAAIDRIAAQHGLRRTTGPAGSSATFDREVHQPIGKAIGDGVAVDIVRPGYEADIDGERVLVHRAVVQTAAPKDVAYPVTLGPGSVIDNPPPSALDRLPDPSPRPLPGTPKAKGKAKRVVGRDLKSDGDLPLAEVVAAVRTPGKAIGYEGQPEDMGLRYIAAQQGFDGPPQLGSAAQLQAEIDRGGVELWRGVSGPEFVDQFKHGEVFYGHGPLRAAGIYATQVKAGRFGADGHAPAGDVIHMVLSPNARVIARDDLEAIRDNNPNKWSMSAEEREAYGDQGRLAAALGYDAIGPTAAERAEGRLYYVVLNRTALIVEDSPTPGTPDAKANVSEKAYPALDADFVRGDSLLAAALAPRAESVLSGHRPWDPGRMNTSYILDVDRALQKQRPTEVAAWLDSEATKAEKYDDEHGPDPTALRDFAERLREPDVTAAWEALRHRHRDRLAAASARLAAGTPDGGEAKAAPKTKAERAAAARADVHAFLDEMIREGEGIPRFDEKTGGRGSIREILEGAKGWAKSRDDLKDVMGSFSRRFGTGRDQGGVDIHSGPREDAALAEYLRRWFQRWSEGPTESSSPSPAVKKVAAGRAAKKAAPRTSAELRDHVAGTYGRHVPAIKATKDDLGRTFRNHSEYQDDFTRRAAELAAVDPNDPAGLRAAAEKWRSAADRERGVSSMRASQRPGTFHHARGTAGMAAADQYENVADYLDRLARDAEAKPTPAPSPTKRAPRAPKVPAESVLGGPMDETEELLHSRSPAALRRIAAEYRLDNYADMSKPDLIARLLRNADNPESPRFSKMWGKAEGAGRADLKDLAERIGAPRVKFDHDATLGRLRVGMSEDDAVQVLDASGASLAQLRELAAGLDIAVPAHIRGKNGLQLHMAQALGRPSPSPAVAKVAAARKAPNIRELADDVNADGDTFNEIQDLLDIGQTPDQVAATLRTEAAQLLDRASRAASPLQVQPGQQSAADLRARARILGDLAARLSGSGLRSSSAEGEARGRTLALLGVTRAAGHDVTLGNDQLHHWWTRGEGRALWVHSDHPFTTLVEQLVEHAHITLERAKTWAGAWYKEVFGYSPGSDIARVKHGKPPRGHLVGPG